MILFQSLTKSELADVLLPLSTAKEERSLRDLTDEGERQALLEKIGKKKRKQAEMRAKQLFHWVYQRYVTDYDQMTDLAKETFLAQGECPDLPARGELFEAIRRRHLQIPLEAERHEDHRIGDHPGRAQGKNRR
jgi:hypothetical protein